MNRLLLWMTVAIILVTNAFVLAHVAHNRTGEPEAVITFTEREAHLSYGTEENSGLALHLVWQQDRPWIDRDPGWFNQAKLESLGFDCSVSLTDLSAEQFYEKALPRMAYVVLEFDGTSWDDFFAKEKARLLSESSKGHNIKEELEDLGKRDSRLIPIDVGNDATRLRGSYPDRTRFLIAPAEVRLVFMREVVGGARKYSKPFIYGHVSLLNRETHVPVEFRGWLDQLRNAEQSTGRKNRMNEGPRYSVTLHYGRSYEPWVVGIKPLTERP